MAVGHLTGALDVALAQLSRAVQRATGVLAIADDVAVRANLTFEMAGTLMAMRILFALPRLRSRGLRVPAVGMRIVRVAIVPLLGLPALRRREHRHLPQPYLPDL